MNAQPELVLPRLVLGPTGSPLSLFDGGWWPRTTDPHAELPGLVLAVDHLHGAVRRLALSADGWSNHPRQIQVGGRTIRLGFFASQPTVLLTALCGNGARVDLLVVPPGTTRPDAEIAMAAAAAKTNQIPVQRIIAADPNPTVQLSEQVWETDRSYPLAVRPRTLSPGRTGTIEVIGRNLV